MSEEMKKLQSAALGDAATKLYKVESITSVENLFKTMPFPWGIGPGPEEKSHSIKEALRCSLT